MPNNFLRLTQLGTNNIKGPNLLCIIRFIEETVCLEAIVFRGYITAASNQISASYDELDIRHITLREADEFETVSCWFP